MVIRKATIKDLKRIQELNLLLFEKEHAEFDKTLNCDWTFSKEGEDFFKERIKSGFAFVVVAPKGVPPAQMASSDEDKVGNGGIIGYMTGSLADDEFYRTVDKFAELDDMFILEEHRDKGYGGMLYDEFVKWCKKKGVKRVKALVTAENGKAIEFYKKKGFKAFTLVLEGRI